MTTKQNAATIARLIYAETLASGGSTVSPTDPGAQAPSTGYAVALAGAETVIPMVTFTVDAITAYVVSNADEIDHTPGVFVGAWADNGLVYLDLSTVIADREAAIETGRTNAQLAIFHLDKAETISL
jgi:hypothetical protein